MADTATGTPGEAKRLSDDQLSQLLALMQEVDSTELKVTVPHSERQSVMKVLDMDPLDAQIREIYFFDTPDLTLDRMGVVVRARRVQAVGDDTVVKLRPVVPSELPTKLRELRDFGVEVDAMPGGFVCSASYKGKLTEPRVRAASRGELPVGKLFSKGQRAFFADHAPGMDLDGLSVLGPITVFKLKWRPKELGRKLVAELWNYPDGSRIVELSTKCPPAEAFQVAAETRAYLHDRGLDTSGDQQTKTRTALEYYSRQLQEAG
jgi:hypothetical protein